jgi:drug/metabolite transporter (DMT)-like permease
MGMTPIFGKQAILAGLSPFAVVAFRTAAAAILVVLLLLVARRSYLAIYPVGLAGCAIAGLLNGLGSVLYYVGLSRVDAVVGQLLFTLYPVHVALLLYLDGQRPSRLTLLRVGLSVPALLLITSPWGASVDVAGAALMFAAGVLYALHILVNERILYEVPAPTVTCYTLLAMAVVVMPFGLAAPSGQIAFLPAAWPPLLALTLVTFLSRLTLFSGVKSVGGLQTAILGLAELLLTLVLGVVWLRETLVAQQWVGAALLIVLLLLAGVDRIRYRPTERKGWLYWLRPPLANEVTTPAVPASEPQDGVRVHQSGEHAP